MARDGVQELRACVLLQSGRALLDHAQPEVHVSEQAPFVCLPEGRPGSQLGNPSDVVQQCRRQQEIGAKSRMELCALPADRCDADRVLEQPAGVGMVRLGRGQPSKGGPQNFV
jgi:hypothetical protein